MPHFFIPINWFLAPAIILLALVLTTTLIYWATPNLKFPTYNFSLQAPAHSWKFISESFAL